MLIFISMKEKYLRIKEINIIGNTQFDKTRSS
jgi:hypothetical protein